MVAETLDVSAADPGMDLVVLVIIVPVVVDDVRCMLSGLLCTKTSVEIKAVLPKNPVEATIDLVPILAEIEEFSPTGEVCDRN